MTTDGGKIQFFNRLRPDKAGGEWFSLPQATKDAWQAAAIMPEGQEKEIVFGKLVNDFRRDYYPRTGTKSVADFFKQ